MFKKRKDGIVVWIIYVIDNCRKVIEMKIIIINVGQEKFWSKSDRFVFLQDIDIGISRISDCRPK